ncbi:MAG TPA: hypothetical protein VNJ53_06830 [Gaiellaceae bacterium]|nr:hypothetical protein [Gaiellaceae bacterium]
MRVLGLAVGVGAGLAAGALAGPAGPRAASSAAEEVVLALEATHLPPLLRRPDERLELRYDAYCVRADDDAAEAPCPVEGAVFARAGDRGPYTEVALREEPSALEGRLRARLPEQLAAAREVSYYARLQVAGGPVVTIPAGGADAPQRSLALSGALEIDLGSHAFGRVRRAAARVARARWGSGSGEVGLEPGRELPPVGGASFDVDRRGAVYLLDEANRRVLRWSDGAVAPEAVPLAVNGTLADLAVGEAGTLYVAETTAAPGATPLLRAFAPDGSPRGSVELAERPARVGRDRDGTSVLQHPSGQWLPVVRGERLLPARDQRRGGAAGLRSEDGSEVRVFHAGHELRVARLVPGSAVRSWILRSATTLGEVQLAEPFGAGVVVVVRAYAADRDEFLVLVLGPGGLRARFAVEDADWAETAPLSRFRLRGASLYQLGSSQEGVFVDRFDLEQA